MGLVVYIRLGRLVYSALFLLSGDFLEESVEHLMSRVVIINRRETTDIFSTEW